MTPPNEEAHEDHLTVANDLRRIGYTVHICDRMPSCYCGDATHRDRWCMIAELESSGPLDMLSFCDSSYTPFTTVMDPPHRVPENHWTSAELDTSSAPRGGVEDFSPSNTGVFVTHSRRIGHCKGYPSEKGFKVYDPKFTLPTITSYGNILIQTPNANGDNTIRYCTIRELANASSFYPEQVAFLDQLDKQKLGFCALQYISSAVPKGLLTTMYRMALFTLHRHEDFNFHSSYYCYTLDDEPFDGIVQGEADGDFALMVGDYLHCNTVPADINSDFTDCNDEHTTRESLSTPNFGDVPSTDSSDSIYWMNTHVVTPSQFAQLLSEQDNPHVE